MKTLGLVGALLILAVGVSIASAELVGSADQIVSFNASIRPSELPRSREIPVTVRTKGKIKPTAQDSLARVRSLEIELNRHGKIFTVGLPICRVEQLVAASIKSALATCRTALVGHGRVVAKQTFPEQRSLEIKGVLLLFNGKYKNSRAILVYVHSITPPSTIIVPFKVSRTHGTFGTRLSGSIAEFLNKWVYLTRFEFVIGRRYIYKGTKHGIVQATCPAPHGANEAIVPFARVTLHFLASKTLRTTLVRSCHVRREG